MWAGKHPTADLLSEILIGATWACQFTLEHEIFGKNDAKTWFLFIKFGRLSFVAYIEDSREFKKARLVGLSMFAQSRASSHLHIIMFASDF